MKNIAEKNYWLLSSGKDGELWPIFWNEKIVAIGWSGLGDLTKYSERAQIDQAFKKLYPNSTSRQRGNNVGQIWSFYRNVKQGELVFVRSYGAIIGIGEIQSDYEFVSPQNPLRTKLHSPFHDDDYPHIRKVRWLSLWGGLKQSLAFTRLTLME